MSEKTAEPSPGPITPAAPPGPNVLFIVMAFGMGAAIAYATVTYSEARLRSAGGRQVADLLLAQQKAWNEGDLDAFVRPYWDDEDLTFYRGGVIDEGFKKVVERYRSQYKSEGKEMGKLTFSDVVVTTLAGDAAQARGRWKVVMKKETLEGLFTLLLLKRPEGWRIVHDHTSK